MTSVSLPVGIVTFNPELGRLKDNLDAISSQTGLILIYDNGSNNIRTIRSFLDAYPCAVLIDSGKNSGMAVALNVLANEAIKREFTDILFLDQDSVAPDGMLAQLAACRSNRIGIIGPKIVDRNESEVSDASGVVQVPRLITSGSLLSLRAFEVVGGYDERLFVDWVDFEFCNNLRIHGYELVRDNDVRLLHEFGHEEYAGRMVHRGKDGRFETYSYYRSNHPEWRMRDRGRSLAITSLKYRNTKLAGEDAAIYRKSLIKTALFERNGLKKAYEMVRGWNDGKRAFRGFAVQD